MNIIESDWCLAVKAVIRFCISGPIGNKRCGKCMKVQTKSFVKLTVESVTKNESKNDIVQLKFFHV